MNKYLKKSGKRSNFILEKSGKPQSDFCTNPDCISVAEALLLWTQYGAGKVCMSVQHYPLIGTRFQLRDVFVRRELGVGLDAGGCEWIDGICLEGLIQIPLFADGTVQLLQASYLCNLGFFTQEATTCPVLPDS